MLRDDTVEEHIHLHVKSKNIPHGIQGILPCPLEESKAASTNATKMGEDHLPEFMPLNPSVDLGRIGEILSIPLTATSVVAIVLAESMFLVISAMVRSDSNCAPSGFPVRSSVLVLENPDNRP